MSLHKALTQTHQNIDKLKQDIRKATDGVNYYEITGQITIKRNGQPIHTIPIE